MKKTKSPVIKKGKAVLLDFYDAIKAIADGKKVTRLEWSSNEEFCFMKDERLMIHTKGEDHLWIVSKGDISNSDWTILPI